MHPTEFAVFGQPCAAVEMYLDGRVYRDPEIESGAGFATPRAVHGVFGWHTALEAPDDPADGGGKPRVEGARIGRQGLGLLIQAAEGRGAFVRRLWSGAAVGARWR